MSSTEGHTASVQVCRDALRLAAALATPGVVSLLQEHYRASQSLGRENSDFGDVKSLLRTLSTICGAGEEADAKERACPSGSGVLVTGVADSAGRAPTAAAALLLADGGSLGGYCSAPSPASSSATQLVLHNEHLLLEALSFVVEGGGVGEVGPLMLVSRLWQRALSTDRVWAPIARSLLPTAQPYHTTTTTPSSRASEREAPGARERVVRYGWAVCRPVFRVGSWWQDGLSFTFEIKDRWDGRRLFWGHGPVHVSVNQNVICRLAGTARTEVSVPFSASDRDPEQQRFPSVREWFRQCHASHVASDLHVRVVAHDQRTGRSGLVYSCRKPTKRHVKIPNAAFWADFLGDSSLYVWDGDSLLSGPQGDSSPIKVAAAFYVVPCDEGPNMVGGGGVSSSSESERLYRVAGGDEERYDLHHSYVSLDFSTTDNEAVGRYIRSLLRPPPPMQQQQQQQQQQGGALVVAGLAGDEEEQHR